LCEYLNWAYITGVDLKDQSSYDELFLSECFSLDLGRQLVYAEIDAENDYVISSGIYAKLAATFSAAMD
jgi:hypothetical protein